MGKEQPEHKLVSQYTVAPQVVMLDALRKRCSFVDAAAARMSLANVSTEWARAEDAGHYGQLREVCSLPHFQAACVHSRCSSLALRAAGHCVEPCTSQAKASNCGLTRC